MCVSLLRASRNLRALLQQQGLEADLQPFIQTFKRFQDAFLEELNKFNREGSDCVDPRAIRFSSSSREKKTSSQLLQQEDLPGRLLGWAQSCWFLCPRASTKRARNWGAEEDGDDQNVVYFEKDYCGDVRPENGDCGVRSCSEATQIQMKAKW